MSILPAGRIDIPCDVVNEKFIASTPSIPYEIPSSDDLYEGIRVLTSYILSRKKGKRSGAYCLEDDYSGIIVDMGEITQVSLCGDCRAPQVQPPGTLLEERFPCASCGSLKRLNTVSMSDTVGIHESIRLRISGAGTKKWHRQMQTGQDFHRDTGTWRLLERVIDRAKDWYYELITSLDGKTVHRRVEEPLSEHQGRGSARKKSD